jgi:Putative adhesin
MKIMRWCFCLMSLFVLASSGLTQTNAKKQVTVITTEHIPFANGVSVHLKDTFGEISIEGWERDEVEIQLTRGTQRDYELAAQTKERRRLEKIKIVATKDGAGGLLIETKNLPFIMKNNLTLEYKIKVPQIIFLKVKHSVGEVRIANIIGDIEATCRIGEIVVNLPEKERYDVDARVKIGEVESEFGGQYNRQKLLGAKLTDEAKQSEPHKLYLRVGIGEVNVKKAVASSR